MATPPPSFAFNSLVEPSADVGQTVPSGFDVQMSYLLASCVNLAVQSYASGAPTIDPSSLPLYTGVASYQQLVFLTAPEAIGVGASSATPGAYVNALIGFALQALDDTSQPMFTVIALRGTQTYQEWINDLTALPQTYALVDNAGSVHSGFYTTYVNGAGGTTSTTTARMTGSLADQIYNLLTNAGSPVPAWPNSVPCYVAGHSLGAALAELCAFDIANNMQSYVDGVTMYAFAPPKVSAGLDLDNIALYNVATFPSAFQAALTSYAIVNAADLVPIMPPTLGTSSIQMLFAPAVAAGNTITYCAQLGDIASNHELSINYLPYTQWLAANASSASVSAVPLHAPKKTAAG